MTFADSIPKRRGIDGPVRSMSSIPTDFPASERESASWVVIEDLPTPPLPESTCPPLEDLPGYFKEHTNQNYVLHIVERHIQVL